MTTPRPVPEAAWKIYEDCDHEADFMVCLDCVQRACLAAADEALEAAAERVDGCCNRCGEKIRALKSPPPGEAKEPHWPMKKHKCMRCGGEFECLTMGCAAKDDVLPRRVIGGAVIEHVDNDGRACTQTTRGTDWVSIDAVVAPAPAPEKAAEVCGSYEKDAGWDTHRDAHSTRRCRLAKGHAGPHDYAEPAAPAQGLITKDDVYKAYRRGHEIGMKDGAEEAQDPAQAAPLAAAEKRAIDADNLLRECEEALENAWAGGRFYAELIARLAARREAAPKAGEG